MKFVCGHGKTQEKKSKWLVRCQVYLRFFLPWSNNNLQGTEGENQKHHDFFGFDFLFFFF